MEALGKMTKHYSFEYNNIRDLFEPPCPYNPCCPKTGESLPPESPVDFGHQRLHTLPCLFGDQLQEFDLMSG